MGKVSQKYLIVSPHSDDALFCCSHVLFLPEYEVQVLTVENDEKRVTEDAKLFEFLNIQYHHLELDFKDESYYGYNKLYPKGVTLENACKYLNEYFGNDTVSEIRENIVNWVRQFLKKNEGYKVLAPWGVGHPFHLFVSETIRQTFSNVDFYREFPHSYKRRSQAQVEEQKKDFYLASSVPVDDFADIKWKLASKFYRSQSGLLFYEQGYIKKNLPEEIWGRKDDLPF